MHMVIFRSFLYVYQRVPSGSKMVRVLKPWWGQAPLVGCFIWASRMEQLGQVRMAWDGTFGSVSITHKNSTIFGDGWFLLIFVDFWIYHINNEGLLQAVEFEKSKKYRGCQGDRQPRDRRRRGRWLESKLEWNWRFHQTEWYIDSVQSFDCFTYHWLTRRIWNPLSTESLSSVWGCGLGFPKMVWISSNFWTLVMSHVIGMIRLIIISRLKCLKQAATGHHTRAELLSQFLQPEEKLWHCMYSFCKQGI